ncbi:PASTA domain-containing protein [Tenacibaculum dicentrarchi]|uniref:Serine/threonine protein kinase n=1 Tax=Tenacibaculum dicentrarchi TaxID=669041 RepID=A0ABM9NWQ8_9FLAO|nr:PASTA domain-containing protein [Tenacibaculum dicentrarchi]MCD8407734.1 PASTA domain-containing protein [Tenacibaculum dicentrarchi]MCD8414972.1 PASTA domain-containing protein [Tenacibaculum dicentrarchi]MCD8420096.1 PASTA domain-containing protein [Tenacibaculum dicentrarchi]MCD8425131.1 PASTA domain-containing protein [Tenacibaculum dicentrarchi]
MSGFSEKFKNLFQFVKSKAFFMQIGIAVASLFITVFVLQWWLGFTTNHDQKIQVPNLHKMSLVEVEKKLKELNLDFIIIDSATYNPEYPKKSVIEQNPAVNDFVKEKRKIYLTLNPSKYRDIEVPNLNGRTKRQATTHLQSQGFIVGKEITWVEDIGKDVVRGLKYNGKEITAGVKLPKKTTINLILGDGNGN